MESSIIPKSECLTCHYKMDRATCIEPGGGDHSPGKDDFSVCLKCGTVSKFDEHLNLVPLEVEELETLKEKWPDVYYQLRRVQAEILKMINTN